MLNDFFNTSASMMGRMILAVLLACPIAIPAFADEIGERVNASLVDGVAITEGVIRVLSLIHI